MQAVPNLIWSMDVKADRLGDRHPFQLPNVRNDFTLKDLGIEIDFQLPSSACFRSLESIMKLRGNLRMVRIDEGRNYISGRLLV